MFISYSIKNKLNNKNIRIKRKTSQVNNHLEPELVYQESNKYIYLYDGDKYTIYSPNQVTAEKRIKEKIKKEYSIWVFIN